MPNPSGGGPAERAYHGGVNGKAVVATKMPGTPRRDTGGHSRERAVQDPGLKDYVRFFLSHVGASCRSHEHMAYILCQWLGNVLWLLLTWPATR